MRTNSSTSRWAVRSLLTISVWLSIFIPLPGVPTTTEAADPRADTGEWAAPLDWQIFGKHMVLMPNGKLLVWPTGEDAFVWDPATQLKSAVPATFGDLHCAGQTLLPDGRVIVAGGVIVSPHDGTAVTAIFDPATNLWTNATPMHSPRWYATTTTLPDGRILVTSGDEPGNLRANIPEIYNAATDTWTLLPATATKDLGLYPEMFVLPNGKLFKAGGSANTLLLNLNLNTDTGTWSNGPTNAFGSSGYSESSAMYEPGKILRSGGSDGSELSFANTAIIDMNAATPQWKQTSAMHFPRRRHNLVILADGEVMAVGGTRSADLVGDGITTGAVYEGEIWNPATELWTVVPRMTKDRMYHSAALLLPDGRVLTAGGENAGRYNAEIYSPPYLFLGTRPTITTAPGVAAYGSNFAVNVTTDGSAISSVALIGLSAVTHAFNHNQRYVPLTFSQTGNSLSATAPANANYAPPGYYMLVVKDSKGVPSIAKFVRIDTAANLLPGAITGTITNSLGGAAIAGATVSYSGGTTTSAADGTYTLSNVPPGEVLVTVSKTGFATVSRTQSVAGNATATLNIALSAPGTITGKVTDSSNGNAIAGAIVTYGAGTTTTDAGGNYTIANIASGNQTLVAAADGYNSSPEQTVSVPANGSVTANIALDPKPTYIAGEVRDIATSNTVAGVTITIGALSTTTDSLGRYQIFVPPGTYSVVASKVGYASSTHPGAIVTFGSYTAIDFGLVASVDPPTVTSFAPTQGRPGVEVTITGTGFTGVTSVSFGGVVASSFTVDSVSQIRAVVPVTAITGKVVVTAAPGTASSTGDFAITPAPVQELPPQTYLPLMLSNTPAGVSQSRTSGNSSLRIFICTPNM